MSRATNNKRTNDKKQKSQKMLMDLASSERLMTCGIYEKISKVVTGAKKEWRKNKRFIEETLDELSEFKDPEYPPENSNLVSLTEQNSKIAKYFAWYRIHAFFDKRKYSVLNNIKLKNQVIRNRGYVYLIDALNTLTVQPGLVLRLFERKKSTREGIYAVWVNIDGRWQQEIVDDHVPIICDHNDKNQFFFTNPPTKDNEIWYMLLEKAMAKAYGGYKNLFQGFENYAVRDLTGAPHLIYDIPPVPLSKAIKQREMDHMNDFWEKLFGYLKRGYIMSLVPRLPTQTEKIANRNLKIPNKIHYMSNGLYSGHNYAVVTIREVKDSMGNLNRIVKLRNPYINEKWQGDWSEDSSLWTENLKKVLNYHPEKEGNYDFWISVRDIMGYFEVLNVYKTQPGYTYNSIDIKSENRRIIRTFVKIVVPETGKYTFSVDQKDLRNWPYRGLRYCQIKLSLGKIEKDNFQLLSHTSSKKLRNTYIRKLIEKGEYYLLVEKSNTDENISLAQQNPKEFEELNSFVVSAYGPKTCGLEIIEDLRKNYAVYDYVCYHGWKWYSGHRLGQKVSEFNVNFYDGTWNKLSLYLLNIPDLLIYAFKNDHQFGVELTAKIGGLSGREVLGPEGKKSYEQTFSMNAGETDVFIFRNTRDDNTFITQENNKFQLKSVVGIKYIGTKDLPGTFAQFYEFLKKINVKVKKTEIEKDPVLRGKIGNYDVMNGMKKIEEEIEDVNQVKVVKMTRPMRLEDYEDLVDANDLIQKEMALEEKNQKIRAKSQPLKYKPGEKIVERIRLEDFLKEKGQNPNNLEAIKEAPDGSLSNSNYSPTANITQNPSPLSQNIQKRAQESPEILENKEEIIDHQANLKSLDKYINSITDIDDNKLAKVLTLQKEELLNIDEEELKQLLKYFGIQAFITIYQVDELFLNDIVKKLERRASQAKSEFTSRADRVPVSSRNRSGLPQEDFSNGTRLGDTQKVDRVHPSKSVGRADMMPRQSLRAYEDRQVVEYPELLQQKNFDNDVDPHLAYQQENLNEVFLHQSKTRESIHFPQKNYSKKVSPSFERTENLKENRTYAEAHGQEKILKRLNEIRGIKERLSQQVSNISQRQSYNENVNNKGLKYQILENQQNNNNDYETEFYSKFERKEKEIYQNPNFEESGNFSETFDFSRKTTAIDILKSSHYLPESYTTEKKQNNQFNLQSHNFSESKTRGRQLQEKIEQKKKERHEYGFTQNPQPKTNEQSQLIQSLEAEKLKQLQEQEELLQLIEEQKKLEAMKEEELRRIEQERKREEEKRREESERERLQLQIQKQQQEAKEEQRRRNEEQQHELMIMERIKQQNEEIKRQHELQKIKESEEKRRNNMMSQFQSNYTSVNHTPMTNNLDIKQDNQSVFKASKRLPQTDHLRNSEMKKPQNYRDIKGPGRKTMGDPINGREEINNFRTEDFSKTTRNNFHTVQTGIETQEQRPISSSSVRRKPSYTNPIPQLEHYDPTVERFNRLKKTLQQKRTLAENATLPLEEKLRRSGNNFSHLTHVSPEPNIILPNGNNTRTINFKNGESSRPQTAKKNDYSGIKRPLTSGSNFIEQDSTAMERIKNTLNRSNYGRNQNLKFHQTQGSQQLILQSPQQNMRESHNLDMRQPRAPYKNKRTRNTTNPALFSRSENNLNAGLQFSAMKTQRNEIGRARLGSHEGIYEQQQQLQGHNNNTNNSLYTQQHQNSRNPTQNNIQVIQLNNQLTRNALTERSASSRQLNTHQNHQNQGYITQEPQITHLQSGQYQNQQPQTQVHNHFSPSPAPRKYPQNQNLRASADFVNSPVHYQQQQQPQMNHQYQQQQQQQQQLHLNQYGNQRPQTSQTQNSNNNYMMNQQQPQQQSQFDFGQSQQNFRPMSPQFNPNMSGMRDSTAGKKLAYGNQDRPKSSRSRGGGGGFLSGLFG